MRMLFLSALIVALCGCNNAVAPVHAQQTGTAGTVSVSWTAPTQNTDGSTISGTLSYTVYEMAPCGSDAVCAADVQPLGSVAAGVTGISAQVSNVPNGLHCYAVQAQETLPNGASTSSALSTVIYENACVNMTGSNATQPSPNVATNVKAVVS